MPYLCCINTLQPLITHLPKEIQIGKTQTRLRMDYRLQLYTLKILPTKALKIVMNYNPFCWFS